MVGWTERDHGDDAPLVAVLVRSQVSRATLRGIDVEEAVAQPGVVGVFVAADIEGARLGVVHGHREVLAVDELHYVGEPFAVVVARDEPQAWDAAGLVVPDYDPLDPLVAPVLVEGDDPDVVRIRIQRLADLGTEPPSPVATWSGDALRLDGPGVDDRLDVNELAALVGIELAQLEVRCDPRTSLIAAAAPLTEVVLAALAARQLGEPVRLVVARSEEITSLAHIGDQVVTVRPAIVEGRIAGLEVSIRQDAGAWPVMGWTDALKAEIAAIGSPYGIASTVGDLEVVQTSSAPVASGPAAGELFARWITENVLDEVADRLGVRPLQLRLDHLAGAPELGTRLQQLIAGLDTAISADDALVGVAGSVQKGPDGWGVHVCAVDVSRETGAITIRQLLSDGSDPRHVASPRGVGPALFEAVLYDEDAQPIGTSLIDYLRPAVSDVPERVLSTDGSALSTWTPYVVVGAVSDALRSNGVRVPEWTTPLDPVQVLTALEVHE